jgi:hypothetical protein
VITWRDLSLKYGLCKPPQSELKIKTLRFPGEWLGFSLGWWAKSVFRGQTSIAGFRDQGSNELLPLQGQRFRILRYHLLRRPLVNSRHARSYRHAKNQWHVENNKSRNGLWVRIDQIPLTASCQFQLREQRFILRVLS